MIYCFIAPITSIITIIIVISCYNKMFVTRENYLDFGILSSFAF